MKIREQHPLDVWARTSRLMPASAFLASLLMGAWAPLGEAEACATGMWSHLNRQWDERALEVVAGGSREEAVRLRRMLGEVDLTGGVRPIGTIASYYVERYGFDRGAFGFPFAIHQLTDHFRDHPNELHLRLPRHLPFPLPGPL